MDNKDETAAADATKAERERAWEIRKMRRAVMRERVSAFVRAYAAGEHDRKTALVELDQLRIMAYGYRYERWMNLGAEVLERSQRPDRPLRPEMVKDMFEDMAIGCVLEAKIRDARSTIETAEYIGDAIPEIEEDLVVPEPADTLVCSRASRMMAALAAPLGRMTAADLSQDGGQRRREILRDVRAQTDSEKQAARAERLAAYGVLGLHGSVAKERSLEALRMLTDMQIRQQDAALTALVGRTVDGRLRTDHFDPDAKPRTRGRLQMVRPVSAADIHEVRLVPGDRCSQTEQRGMFGHSDHISSHRRLLRVALSDELTSLPSLRVEIKVGVVLLFHSFTIARNAYEYMSSSNTSVVGVSPHRTPLEGNAAGWFEVEGANWASPGMLVSVSVVRTDGEPLPKAFTVMLGWQVLESGH